MIFTNYTGRLDISFKDDENLKIRTKVEKQTEEIVNEKTGGQIQDIFDIADIDFKTVKSGRKKKLNNIKFIL